MLEDVTGAANDAAGQVVPERHGLDAVRNRIISQNGLRVSDDDPILIAHTINEALLDDLDALLVHHAERNAQLVLKLEAVQAESAHVVAEALQGALEKVDERSSALSAQLEQATSDHVVAQGAQLMVQLGVLLQKFKAYAHTFTFLTLLVLFAVSVFLFK